MDFFGTFRGRLLLIFAFLTIATLGVQYYLNLYMQNENDVRRALHDKALFSGLKLGVSGITSGEYMTDMIAEPAQAYLDGESRDRIRDIIIVNNNILALIFFVTTIVRGRLLLIAFAVPEQKRE